MPDIWREQRGIEMMPDCNRPACHLPMPVKWRESRANGGSLGEMSDMDRNQFSLWFSGFIDGEGNFQVFLDRHYLRAIFRIRLHIDDIAILYKIKEFLGVGNVSVHGSNCLFSITNIRDMQKVLIPLLDKYNLFTTK